MCMYIYIYIYMYMSMCVCVCVCHCSCANRQWPQNHPQPPGVFHNSWEMIAKSFFAAWIRCVNGRRLALGFPPTSGPYRAIGSIGHLAACA